MASRFRLLVLAVAGALLVAGLGIGVVTGQDSGPTAYYGDAEMEDGTDLPEGTTIVAVANGTDRDSIEVSPSGQYGNDSPTEPDSKLVVDTDETVHFYVEKDDGTRIEALTTADPTEADGAVELNLTFPEGTVTPAPYFAVSNLQPSDETVVDGETVDVTADITNQVDSGTQTVEFRVNGQTRESTELTLDTDEQQTVSFSLDTATLGTGSHTYSVATENESQQTSLTVSESQVDFTVSEFDPVEASVADGESVDVSATITNDGNTGGTQTVSFDLDGQQRDSQEVSLDPGEQTSVSFTLDTTDVSVGDHSHAISTANDSQSGSLTVEPRRAEFTVAELDPGEETVVTGEVVDVSATVTNDGNTEGTQTVSFDLDGSTNEERNVTLAAGESTTVTFSGVDTAELGPGSYGYSVASANDSQSATLTVEDREPATFTLSALSPTEATVTRGATVDISATVSNVGQRDGTQQVQLTVDGQTVDEQTLSLGSGESTEVTLTAATESLTPASYAATVSTANDTESATVTVEGQSPAEFAVANLQPTETTVERGETVDVLATVRNDGEAAGTQQVRLTIDGDTVDSQSVSLDAGDETAVRFNGVGTGSLAPGDHTHAVASDDDTQSGTLTVTSDTETSEPTTGPTDDDRTSETTEGGPTDGGQTTQTGAQNTTTASDAPTTEEADDGGSGGGLLPMGLIRTVAIYVGIPLAVIYGILKGLAIYLGY